MNNLERYKMIKTSGMNPKVLEALVSAAAGAAAGGTIGAGSAMLVPHKFDPLSASDEEGYVRDPVGQGLRSALVGALIGGSKPWVEDPLREWLMKQEFMRNV